VLWSYIIDKLFGEFSFVSFYKHPVIFMGIFIKWFENNFYKDTIFRGGLLTFSLVCIVICLIYIVLLFVKNLFLLALIGSITLASNMLYNSVKKLLDDPDTIKYLVSRDTKDISLSDKYKAGIETYAENLSDGVVAPLFYMVLFGLYGAFIYKAINTLDSMVGYRTKKYENFGKISAIIDDILNYIPSRITALIIAILFLNKKALFGFYSYGKLHLSPNAGMPISALALSLDISLGGDTSYFGKLTKKPYFGDGTKVILKYHLQNALRLQNRFDIFILLTIMILIVSYNMV